MVEVRGASCDSNYTAAVYGAIKNGDYDEAVQILEAKLTNFPKSRAALSLLGYCYYHQQDYSKAATTYERLVTVCPDVEQYRIHYAQSLFKAGSYVEADRVASGIDSRQHAQVISMLRASIKYEQEELYSCRAILDECTSDDPDTIIALASVSFREGKFNDARDKYVDAMNTIGYRAELAYNIAVCHYRLQNYKDARNVVSGIIERAMRYHPELMVQEGSRSEGYDRTSVGNSSLLQESYLVEAFNLRAAIAYETKNIDEAKDALSEMPPRVDEELDPVTLHNQALFHVDDDATASLQKMNFLVANPPFPPETFGNLLLLQLKYGFHDVAETVMKENSHLTDTILSEELFDFLLASIVVKTDPDEAHQKLDNLASKYLEKLRKLPKTRLSATQSSRNPDDIKLAQREVDKQIEKYLPVLMARANMYWENANYPMVESILRQSADFCGENETWMLNVAHTCFMVACVTDQHEGKFRDAVGYYEQIVERGIENGSVLDVQAIVLANLCVAYLMTAQSDIAEDLLKKIKKEEHCVSGTEPNEPLFHSCIVGLVLGTFYCTKGNYGFGMERICASLEPYDRKLSSDMWFYAKRCFLTLAESMSKNLLTVDDTLMHVIMPCVEKLTQFEKRVSATNIDENGKEFGVFDTTVAYEARKLKPFFTKFLD